MEYQITSQYILIIPIMFEQESHIKEAQLIENEEAEDIYVHI